MTKTQKIIIGIVSVMTLFGLYYLYLFYKSAPLSAYYSYCYDEAGKPTTDEMCSKIFQETCKNTGGNVKKTTECRGKDGSFLSSYCEDKNVECLCPILKKWTNEEGCI